jgi:hypothetical protein
MEMLPCSCRRALADDIAEMRSRAELNRTYIHVKLPPLLVCASYKAENSIGDIHNFVLTLPTYEYQK